MTDRIFKTTLTISLIVVALIPIGFYPVDAWGEDDSSGAKATFGVLEMIENDLRNGVISLEEKTLLEVRAIRDPKSLPESYRISSESLPQKIRLSGRCATGTLLKAMRIAPTLSAGAQAELSQLMARPPMLPLGSKRTRLAPYPPGWVVEDLLT